MVAEAAETELSVMWSCVRRLRAEQCIVPGRDSLQSMRMTPRIPVGV